MGAGPGLEQTISRIVRHDRGRLLAALIAALGDFELSEEALSDALESALVHWARTGLPQNPHAWLLRVARRKAIDRIRRGARFRARRDELERLAREDEDAANADAPDIPDERLRLIFTCCHPALAAKTRVALTLRTLGGLSTAEVARAFLDRETTMGQRLARARSKISRAGIPYAVPGPDKWDERLGSVLAVIYLIFNEGYTASSGDVPVRADLCDEAIFLVRMLDELRPEEPEVLGLLALMLTTHARRGARLSPAGVAVSLKAQDRALWDRRTIDEGVKVLSRAVALGRRGPYQIKAAISALHVSSGTSHETDWPQILLLYDALLSYEPTAVVRLNRAVALAQAGGLEAALRELTVLKPELAQYQPFHAAHAELLARAGDVDGAHGAYRKAIALCGNDADKAFLTHQKAYLPRYRP